MSSPVDVPIRDEAIKLGQLLKLANLVEDGAEARIVIIEGLVTVDGEVDTRRSAQIPVGAVVCLEDECVRVTRR
ncbi:MULTISPECIES: RNA-binding S4 domain-containing protein [Dermacoccus]|uniref:RNA-binding S4 domain-containing protein n=1 Tax=Dermacoccus TaxID=57495 RepID=UPI000641891C|nr:MULTISPECIES: RNA-binding S4 domain-containing protein [Dermacoccus]KLO62477.1 RNA-binding protein S4 [Dermacoccus sp. PE3]MBZ4496614.1 RNA-binding S4 domain-containing protein [Dermacoccus sp. Tok2021]RYI22838.1 RNA-binding S4 domain-containing protein [Dermacoccus sp. 147Ba]